MVDNVFIQCDYCKAKIRMRFKWGTLIFPLIFPAQNAEYIFTD